jgi:lysophospholipase L1-like esterase
MRPAWSSCGDKKTCNEPRGSPLARNRLWKRGFRSFPKKEADVKSLTTRLRGFVALALVIVLSWPDTSHYFAQTVSSARWTGTWAVAPWVISDDGFNNQTVRQIVHTSIGGSAARVRFSNLYGAQPVTIGDVHIAQRASGAQTVAGTDRAVTFNGQSYVTIPAGGSVQSDAVSFTVPQLTDLAVSAHIPSQTPPGSTGHVDALQDVYVAPGDVSADPTFSGGVTNPGGRQSYYFLTNLDVVNAAATGAVVAFGASITDGLASTANTNRRWPNRLAERLIAAGMNVGVLNQGISGNALFTDGIGQAGLTRFSRDALAQTNAKWVIISDDAINSLTSSSPPGYQKLVSGYQQMITAAHAAGIGVICSTLTPFKNVSGWTPAAEDTRVSFNQYLRSGTSGCDAVFDQSRLVGLQAANSGATTYQGTYNSGDGLHPNDAGMLAIANGADLNWFAALPSVNTPAACGHLMPGEGLTSAQTLLSCGGNIALRMQNDGWLSVMQNGATLWSSRISGTQGAEIRMLEDGNLVMYDAQGAIVWTTNTGGNPGAYARLQDNGSLVICTAQGTVIWSSAG